MRRVAWGLVHPAFQDTLPSSPQPLPRLRNAPLGPFSPVQGAAEAHISLQPVPLSMPVRAGPGHPQLPSPAWCCRHQFPAPHGSSEECTVREVRKLGPREVKWLASAGKGQRLGSNPFSWLHPTLGARGLYLTPSQRGALGGCQWQPPQASFHFTQEQRPRFPGEAHRPGGPGAKGHSLCSCPGCPSRPRRMDIPDEEGGCSRGARGASCWGARGRGDQGCRAGPTAAPRL